jgi:hypothetical protein
VIEWWYLSAGERADMLEIDCNFEIESRRVMKHERLRKK